MPSQKPQAISGVSADVENIVRIEYPSVASMGFGRWLGRIYDSIPVKIGGIKLSNLLFTWPTIPAALVLYAILKLAGVRYVLTNKSVQQRASLGEGLISEVPLAEIDEVLVNQLPGQTFYKAADLVLLAADGNPLMCLGGITRAEVFRQTILEARDARVQVEASLATIQARQSA